MSFSQMSVNADLVDWNDIEEEYNWSGLLVGNGASIAIWDKFKYKSLYRKALKNIEHPLSSEDQEIFETVGAAHDFERVLAALWTTKGVCQSLDLETQSIRKHYQNIQRALIEAVHAVHIPWSNLSEEILRKIRSAIVPYESIFSTNYDLLLYWTIMAETPPSHKDYFWNGPDFDITNTEIREGSRILYLHGALHLVKYPYGGGTSKLISARGDLLSQFGRSLRYGRTPLFVTEGTAQDKLATIRGSDYLSFAFEQFANFEGNLVVFGHSLGTSDQHLIDALKRRPKTIAISMRPTNANKIMENKLKLQREFPNAIFFNSETHPLGRLNPSR